MNKRRVLITRLDVETTSEHPTYSCLTKLTTELDERVDITDAAVAMLLAKMPEMDMATVLDMANGYREALRELKELSDANND